jgi:hypothetical protein
MSTSQKINDNSEINDIRQSSQFKGVTFSGFKKTEVRDQLIDNLKKGIVEPACYWCAEMVCSGHYLDIWEIIFYFMGKHIHLGNPKMAIYLQMRYQIFRNIFAQGLFVSELQLRNNSTIRRLFAELVCNIALSNKKPGFESIKINRREEFDITQMSERLKAPSTKYVESIFKPKDPKELMIAINEFGYNISPEIRNMNNACYWIEWLIEFDGICKGKKEPTKCEPRVYSVENKFRGDIIWLIWDTILECSSNHHTELVQKIISAILELFCVKYTTATSKKRRYLLYFAVALMTEPYSMTGEIIADKTVLESVVSHIGNVYKQIKKNEHSPNTDYLFAGMERENNFEKTVQKMELMNSMDWMGGTNGIQPN